MVFNEYVIAYDRYGRTFGRHCHTAKHGCLDIMKQRAGQ